MEVDAPITAGMPAYKGVDGSFAAGEAFVVTRAEFRVAGVSQQKPVESTDKAVTFTARLKRGQMEMQTWFRDANGADIAGAYYVYVSGPKS